MLTTLLPPTSRHGPHRGLRRRQATAASVRSTIGVALQAAALDPNLNAWEHMDLQTALQGIPKAQRKQRAAELIERVGLTDAADRPRRRVLGRDEAPARPRAGARPPAARAVPRRADDRARPPEPHRAVGGGGAAREGGGNDGLPHHPVPGGGRRHGRPGRDHRPRRDRGRGHPGAPEGGDRPADRRGGARERRRVGRRSARCSALRRARRTPRTRGSPSACARAWTISPT